MYFYDFKTSSIGSGFWDLDPSPPIPLDLQLSPKLIYRTMHAKESKDDLDSGFHAMESEFWKLDFGLFVSGTWIPDSGFRIPDSTFVGFLTLEFYSTFQSPGF